MPCIVCGDPSTCKAHIVPAAFGKDIIKQSDRKGLSLLAPDRTDDFIQSGFFDSDILCTSCDGKLGIFDDHAITVSRLLGSADEVIDRKANTFTLMHAKGIDHEKLALFAASVVWRTSVTSYRELSEFTLGNNEPWFRDMIFRQSTEIPTVLVARLVGANANTHKAAAAALSYPVRVRMKSGKSMARFVVRGLMFLVQTTRASDRSLQADAVTTFGRSAGVDRLTGALMPFEQLGDLPQIEKSKYIQKILNP